METETEKLQRKIETLRRENAELKEKNRKLKQSAHEWPPLPPRPPKLENSHSQLPSSAVAVADNGGDSKLQRKLDGANEQLNEMRKRLLDVQDRLTVAEQVTAATQRRQMVEEGVYENLPTDNDYEELRFDPTLEHDYTELQLTTHTGCVIVLSRAVRDIHYTQMAGNVVLDLLGFVVIRFSIP